MNECFPYLARRLLTEDSERMHKMLRTFLYGKDGRYLKVTGLDGQHETTEKKRKNLGSIFIGVCRCFFFARSCSSVRLGHGVPAGWEVCVHHGRFFAVSWSERVDCLVARRMPCRTLLIMRQRGVTWCVRCPAPA